jgi:hypothetical protein
MYFRVRTMVGKRYILRYNEDDDEWTLQSGFEGGELLSRPDTQLLSVDPDVIRRAEKMIIACEHCHPEDANIPLDWECSRKGVPRSDE